MAGVAVASMALIITLSVFNGFHDLVASLFTAMDPQLVVVPKEGKTVPADDPLLDQIRKMPEVDVAMDCVEDNALAVFGDRQAMVKIKGVEDNFTELTHINDILYGEGEFSLHAANLQYGTIGIRLAETLGTSARWEGFLKIYAPKREGQLDMANPSEGFVEDSLISPGVVFYVRQAKYDANYIIAPIAFARNLFDQQGMVTNLELKLKNGTSVDRTKSKIKDIVGEKYDVLDRYEQQEDTFKIQHHWLTLDAYHRQERRRGDAAQPWCHRQADNAHIPSRRTTHCRRWSSRGHCTGTLVVPRSTDLRTCETGKHKWLIHR